MSVRATPSLCGKMKPVCLSPPTGGSPSQPHSSQLTEKRSTLFRTSSICLPLPPPLPGGMTHHICLRCRCQITQTALHCPPLQHLHPHGLLYGGPLLVLMASKLDPSCCCCYCCPHFYCCCAPLSSALRSASCAICTAPRTCSSVRALGTLPALCLPGPLLQRAPWG